MSAQLHLIMVGWWQHEPLNIVMNALDNHGFEAWRRLTNLCEPETASRFRGLLRELLGPPGPNIDGFTIP